MNSANEKSSFSNEAAWDDLLKRKPDLSKLPTKDREWITRLANNEKWSNLFDDCPEWATVYAVELRKINERRGQRPKSTDDKNEESTDSYDNLVGLAFSGGGIRSASFGLGVLEALRDYDLLKSIDYLSTVSGGGYIGAWLSANCRRSINNGISSWLSRPQEPQKPERSEEGQEEEYEKWVDECEKWEESWTESIRHLRRYSNYLSPEVGFFSADTWTMATVWLRNTLLVQLTIILGIAALLSLSPLVLFSLFEWWPHAGNWHWLIIALSMLSIAGIAGNNWRLSREKIPFLDSDAWWKGALLSVVFLITAMIIAANLNISHFHHENDLGSSRGFRAVDAGIALLLVAASFFALPGMMKLVERWFSSKFTMNYTQGMVQSIIVLPTMVVGLFVAATLWHQSQLEPMRNWNSFGQYFAHAWEYLPFLLTVVFASVLLFSFCCVRIGNEQEQSLASKAPALLRRFAAALLVSLPAILVLYALLAGTMLLLHELKLNEPQFHEWLFHKEIAINAAAFVWTPLLVSLSFFLTVIALLGALGRETREGIREWWSRLGAWLAIYGIGGSLVLIFAIYGPQVINEIKGLGMWQGILGGGWIGTTLAGVFAGSSGQTKGVSTNSISTGMLEVLAKIAPYVFVAGLFILVSVVLNATVLQAATVLTNNCPEAPFLKYWTGSDCKMSFAALTVGALCFVGFILLGWRTDINEFSFNAFYRNRLARCYLGATRRPKDRNPQSFTGFDDKDDLPLSELAESEGPLHIINCALNLGGSKDLDLHTRHSAIYTFTPLFYGSSYKMKGKDLPEKGVEIGFIPTNQGTDKFYQPTLGQAISISGAAASPNMGYHTSPVTAFLMTLFNVRLAGWFPNPHATGITRSSPRFSMMYLLMELFGLASERSNYVSVSDGGHFENLAAYELVKRKCKVIIISDAECDPGYQFEGLGTLIRMCEVDFGAKIKIDASVIKPDGGSAWSRNRSAVGTITYKDKSEGILIYIKASMSGHEGTAVMQYKLTHSDFPHDTTADQFYGEDQFESYRSLGRDITHSTFARVVRPSAELADQKAKSSEEQDIIIEYANRLKNIFSPMLPNIGQFSYHTDRLMELLTEMNADQGLKSLCKQLSMISSEPADADFHSEFLFCNKLIQLMENVYHALNLEETWEHPDTYGWSTIFKQWARSETFRKAWKMTCKNYGLRFNYFCAYRLGLPDPTELWPNKPDANH